MKGNAVYKMAGTAPLPGCKIRILYCMPSWCYGFQVDAQWVRALQIFKDLWLQSFFFFFNPEVVFFPALGDAKIHVVLHMLKLINRCRASWPIELGAIEQNANPVQLNWILSELGTVKKGVWFNKGSLWPKILGSLGERIFFFFTRCRLEHILLYLGWS